LNKQFEDGIPIEPEFYAPIIPMVLVNGSSGIGTGFSTDIPPFNPIDCINNIINMIDKVEYNEMTPYWRGFTGTVNKQKGGKYEITGKYHIEGDIIHITELPIGTWTQNYKEFLEKEMESVKTSAKVPTKGKAKKTEQFIVDYKEYHTDTTVHFAVECINGFLDTCKDIEKTFKLTTSISVNNMHMFGVSGKIQKYDTIEDIMREFYAKRLSMYDDRKQYILDELQHHINLISNKVRFILMVVNDELIINKRKRCDIEKDLEKHKFPKLASNVNDDEGLNYNYLLNMMIYNLTFEKIEELKKQQKEKEEEYNTFKKIRPEDIWKGELIELREVLEKEIIVEVKPVKKISKKKK
jgi:DNA topoisomerase-2